MNKDMPFSTKDADHDSAGLSCSELGHGAWWYNNCQNSNLNGKYYNFDKTSFDAVFWNGWTLESLKTVAMKMRSAMFPGQQYHESILKLQSSKWCTHLLV